MTPVRWRLPSGSDVARMLESDDVATRIVAAWIMWAKAVRLGFILAVALMAAVLGIALLLGGLR